nr:hypothetical protein [Paracoccus saliphilus]
MTIQIIDGTKVSFPFELKDAFRKVFPSAQWNAADRAWVVGPRSTKRLEQWVQLVNESRIVEKIATREAAALNDQEMRSVRSNLSSLRDQIAEVASHSVTREEIQAEREKLKPLKAKLAAAKSEEADLHAAIEDAIGVSVAFINGLRRNMASGMNGRASGTEVFDEACAQLRQIRERLRVIGIESEQLNASIIANRNRPDRDKQLLAKPLVFRKIEEEG